MSIYALPGAALCSAYPKMNRIPEVAGYDAKNLGAGTGEPRPNPTSATYLCDLANTGKLPCAYCLHPKDSNKKAYLVGLLGGLNKGM